MGRIIFYVVGPFMAIGLASGAYTVYDDGTSDIWMQLLGVAIGVWWLVSVVSAIRRRNDPYTY
jgi:hypothetical protein